LSLSNSKKIWRYFGLLAQNYPVLKIAASLAVNNFFERSKKATRSVFMKKKIFIILLITVLFGLFATTSVFAGPRPHP